MTVYSLVFSESGEIVDGNDYLDLDQAYDVAEMYSAEQRRAVTIVECQGINEYEIARIKNFQDRAVTRTERFGLPPLLFSEKPLYLVYDE